jgi:hypothetical protein
MKINGLAMCFRAALGEGARNSAPQVTSAAVMPFILQRPAATKCNTFFSIVMTSHPIESDPPADAEADEDEIPILSAWPGAGSKNENPLLLLDILGELS